MSRVKEIWEQGADIYDEIYVNNVAYHQSHAVIVDLLPRNGLHHILDVGAGTGLLASIILQKFTDCKLTCLDFSPNMLEKAQDRLSSFESRVDYVCADLRTWTAPVQYDTVVTCNALFYKEMDLQQCYRKYADCLRRDGILINSTVVRKDDLPELLEVMKRSVTPTLQPVSQSVAQFARTTGKDISHFGEGSLAVAETVESHLHLMNESGLISCCPWHYMAQAVLWGRKAA